jgi:lipid II:glycine glycyltransferase (peptidoglycan interpeptide bridge formation enzyme)
VTKSDEDLLKDMNESCRKRVKKSIEKWLEFRVVDQSQHEVFFAKRQETAGKKWFNTITKTQYQNLLKYITEGKWMLIGAFLENEMIAWTVCLFDGEFIICPYGFSDRNFNNIGVQHFLKFKLFVWAREHGFVYVDTGGGAPTGFPEHELAGVTEFKESLGGEKIEYYGNYDVVINKFLYKLFKIWYKIKK